MAQIEAFRAIRYTLPDLSEVVAPPYDILTEADKKALLGKSDQNIVSIDLPHVPPKIAGPDAAYQRAAGELVSWLDTRHLTKDDEPALYVYHQTYSHDGKTLTRKKFFARLRLEEFGKGKVYPHEQTFGGPKEDRLKLTQATRCNLSPIFGLYPDPKNEVATLLDRAIGRREPDAQATMDGVQNRLWVVTDADVIDQTKAKLAPLPIYIADGHHRYGTALAYRQLHVEEYGEPQSDDPVNFVLAVLCGMEDPGATIQPYFRTLVDLPKLSSASMKQALSEKFKWSPIPRPRTDRELVEQLAQAGSAAIALYFAAEDVCAVITPKDADLLGSLEPKRKPAWRKLAYSIFHRYIIDEVISPKFAAGKPPTIHYHKTLKECVADAAENAGIAVLMPATTMKELSEVCAAGELMPQKSTYFFPKLATGMVINPLYEL